VSLYENIHKKRKSGRKMRNKGDKGAPSEQDFVNAAKTAKNAMYGGTMKKNMMGGGKVYSSMNNRYANGGKIYPAKGKM